MDIPWDGTSEGAVWQGLWEAEDSLEARLPESERDRFFENMEIWVNEEMVGKPITPMTMEIIKEKSRHLYETMLIEAFI